MANCGCDCEKITYFNMGGCTPVLANINLYYTKEEVDAKIEDISGLTPSDVESIVEDYTYDKVTIDEKIAEGGTFDPTQYYNRTQTDSLLAEKLDLTAYTPTDLSNYDTKSEVNAKISNATTPINNSLTAHTANTTVHVTAAERTAWNAKADIWQGTKAQYDAIQEKDPNVIYLIYNE